MSQNGMESLSFIPWIPGTAGAESTAGEPLVAPEPNI